MIAADKVAAFVWCFIMFGIAFPLLAGAVSKKRKGE